MKKIVFILFFSLISIAAISQTLASDTIQYEKEYYQKRTAIFNSEPVIKGKIIFLGNSITQFGDWKKLLNDSSVINRGIAADNTQGVLARLNDVIIRQPAKLFIEVGINDIAQNIPPQIIIKNILLIIERVHTQSPETEIYVDSILPTNDNAKNDYPDVFNKNDQINAIDDQLERNAKGSRYTYIDLKSKLKDKNGKLDAKYAMPDGLHLNKLGYNVWVDFLKTKKYL
ncbi:GDSL-type esterase/lipase family protein [Mucilaginibacter sp.]|uniref:GDSL-type esterase/lipase family protein n=1 Tax=Mucilaginibacter sp. TaxID=1882438 RepID=UPI0026265B24|nr:GDSL-type esterase/lipase family protein [Mucilaginibacter sp.]MDB5127960.1 family lipase [Mucilaginibacter sp.]